MAKKTKKTSEEKQVFTMDGEIVEILPKAQFRVELKNKVSIIASPSGKIRVYSIRLFRGDKVKVEISPYDLKKGRIIYCYRRFNK